MATGTGKTITALYSIKELLKDKEIFTVIAVPYIHLVTQWYEDAIRILTDCSILRVYGEIHSWDLNIINSIFYNRLHENKKNIVIITTMNSFDLPRFDNVVSQVKCPKLLVVDEAHNFINKVNDEKYNYDYKLGLSATPVFGNDTNKTEKLLDFFGGLVYSLPIEKAIGVHLVNYYYHPLYAYATDDEEKEFNKQTNKMVRCFKDGVLVDQQSFSFAYRARLRVISMASNKIDSLPHYIDKISKEDHFIVYCSDGKILEANEEKKHIQYAIDILNKKGYKPSKFTASESMDDRIRLINDFTNGYISSLVAIRCLDEGINIPSIETALILSSNDNYREFVQRRGRILRKFENKTFANIYDVILLPSSNCKGMAQIELRRFYEYAKIALNKDELIKELESKMNDYGLNYEDIMFNTDIDNINNIVEGNDLDD